MGKSLSEPALLDCYVRAFEEALASGTEPDLRAYLPEAGDPLYREVLSELVRIDLEASWEKGRPRPLVEYRLRVPEAFERPEEVEALAFEEYRLRRQAGEDPAPEEYESTYGISTEGWPRPLGAEASAWFSRPSGGTWNPRDTGTLYHSCAGSAFHDRLLRDLCLAVSPSTLSGGRAPGEMPGAGTEFLGFRLLEELGRGAFGRVFLAEQPSLASRKVALKVTVEGGGESQALAQLQHTHIVPVYSNHQDGPLHAVCMPYLGSVTLADVLAELKGAPRQAGGELLEALAACLRKKGKEGEGPGVPEVTRKRLQGMDFAEAVTWLGACLADGLAHAHERGILHRDLKPANVLLADEGVPMLLDFNLAEDVKLRGAGSQVGGTLAYMAPEHLRAFRGEDPPGGTAGPPRAGERSDLFSLGMVLFEVLTGRSPFPAPARSPSPSDPDGVGGLLDAMIRDRSGPPPSARAVTQRARRDAGRCPPALDAILRRCLEPDPASRYASARQLREDLQCQLDALPLRHTREPALRERIGKLFRRSPRLLGRLVASAALVAVALSLWVGQRAWSQKQQEQARREHLARAQDALSSLDRTHRDYRQAAFLLDPRDTPEWREKGRAVCDGILKRYGVLTRDDWQHGPRVALLSGPTRERLLGEVGEVLLLSAEGAADGAGLREALELNERAEGCFAAVPPAVYFQRAELLGRLGRKAEAERARGSAEALAPGTARDHYLLGRERLRGRRLKEARELLEKATWLDPTSVRAWFLKGVCCDLLHDDDAALGCYDVCVAAAADFPGAYFNRGTAHLRKKSYRQAEADFTRVLALQPADHDAHVNRALARLGGKDYSGALADLDRALELDGSVTRLYFLRSRVRARAGDEAGAKADFEEGLRRKPADVKSWNALGNAYLSRRDYRAALDAFEEALKLNPNSRADLASKSHVLAERLGRNEEALAVQDRLVRLYPDHTPARCGRGVLLARLGRRGGAVEDAAEVLARTRSPDLVYQAGCIYALTSREKPEDAARAFNLLHEALRKGFGAQYLPTDPDLEPLRGRPEFRRLEALARELRSPPAPETEGGEK